MVTVPDNGLPGIRILLVDDDEFDIDLIRNQLAYKDQHLTFVTVNSASKAKDVIVEDDLDCIISDYQMPGTSGLDLLKWLKVESGRDIPFIFLTGQGSERVAAEALRFGASDYFTKEISFAHFDRLVNSIRQHVQAMRDRQAAIRDQRELDKTRLMLQRAREIADLGSWAVQLTDRRVIADSVAYDIYGIPRNTPLTLEDIQSVPLEQYRPQLDTAFTALVTKGEKYDLEFEIRRQNDGEIRLIRSGAIYLEDEGRVTGFIQDIT